MILLPNWAVNIGRRLQRLSDWIDAKFFPLPATPADRKAKAQSDIEQCAAMVSAQINGCKKLKDTYDAHDALTDFRNIWGRDIQASGWYDTLLLELRNKQDEIINNIKKY